MLPTLLPDRSTLSDNKYSRASANPRGSSKTRTPLRQHLISVKGRSSTSTRKPASLARASHKPRSRASTSTYPARSSHFANAPENRFTASSACALSKAFSSLLPNQDLPGILEGCSARGASQACLAAAYKSSNLFLSSDTSAPRSRSNESNDSPPTLDADWGAIWPLSAASNSRCSGCGRAMPGPASDMDLAVVARMRTWETSRADAVASASAAAR
mmetsp:Transcript_8133/g.22867  ORF Transcript_8133/g.22867 Transcript_8133/m.22867 type:complete len:216 (-) Transcript_8133:146-793(-)